MQKKIGGKENGHNNGKVGGAYGGAAGGRRTETDSRGVGWRVGCAARETVVQTGKWAGPRSGHGPSAIGGRAVVQWRRMRGVVVGGPGPAPSPAHDLLLRPVVPPPRGPGTGVHLSTFRHLDL